MRSVGKTQPSDVHTGVYQRVYLFGRVASQTKRATIFVRFRFIVNHMPLRISLCFNYPYASINLRSINISNSDYTIISFGLKAQIIMMRWED